MHTHMGVCSSTPTDFRQPIDATLDTSQSELCKHVHKRRLVSNDEATVSYIAMASLMWRVLIAIKTYFKLYIVDVFVFYKAGSMDTYPRVYFANLNCRKWDTDIFSCFNNYVQVNT